MERGEEEGAADGQMETKYTGEDLAGRCEEKELQRHHSFLIRSL